MSWQVIVDNFAKKQTRKFPKNDSFRIAKILEELISNPYAGDVSKMEGRDDVWRRRTGSYRIFYEVDTVRKIIYVFDIKRRTSKTY